jgi:hypothetical protein
MIRLLVAPEPAAVLLTVLHCEPGQIFFSILQVVLPVPYCIIRTVQHWGKYMSSNLGSCLWSVVSSF